MGSQPGKRLASLLLLTLSGGISLLWGISLERGPGTGVMGFPGIYFGTRCLLENRDPYRVEDLERVYAAAGFGGSAKSEALQQSVTLYVNLPPTFLLVAPFAALPLRAAQMLWTAMIVAGFSLAAFLMWQLGSAYSPAVATLLSMILLANCEVIFAGGNTAGLVVSLCVLAAWCILKQRFAVMGEICLGLGLAVKPHDAGLIWLYLLLAGPVLRRHAIRSATCTAALTIAAVFWVSHVAPHWPTELAANLKTISVPGGINDPSPESVGVNSPDMIIDLQTVVSCFTSAPAVYNVVSFAICALLLGTWVLAIRRTELTVPHMLYALAAAAGLSMLATYHRSYDAKLLLLAVPACAILWVEGGGVRWPALGLTMAGIFITGDIPMAAVAHLTQGLKLGDTLGERIRFVVLARPAPLVLFALSAFYLWILLRQSSAGAADAVRCLPGLEDRAINRRPAETIDLTSS